MTNKKPKTAHRDILPERKRPNRLGVASYGPRHPDANVYTISEGDPGFEEFLSIYVEQYSGDENLESHLTRMSCVLQKHYLVAHPALTQPINAASLSQHKNNINVVVAISFKVEPKPPTDKQKLDYLEGAAPHPGITHEEGAHYRFGMNCPSCNHTINVDPYRLDSIVGPMDAPAFHMMKKLMRGTKKGATKQKLVSELLCCAERWKALLIELGEWEEGWYDPIRATVEACANVEGILVEQEDDNLSQIDKSLTKAGEFTIDYKTAGEVRTEAQELRELAGRLESQADFMDLQGSTHDKEADER